MPRGCGVWEANLSRTINRVYLKIYGVTDFLIGRQNIGQCAEYMLMLRILQNAKEIDCAI